MIKYNRMIIKSLKGKKRFLYVCFFISIIAFSLFSAYSMFYETKEQNRVDFVRQEFGDYHAAFYSVDSVEADMISENDNVDFIIETPMDACMLGENTSVLIQYMLEEEMKHTGSQLCDGRFPTGENEIAVEKWFMLQQGYTGDEILGAKLVCTDSRGNQKTYQVTGLICERMSDNASMSSHFNYPLMIMNKTSAATDSLEFRNLYVKYKDTERMLNEMVWDIRPLEVYRDKKYGGESSGSPAESNGENANDVSEEDTANKIDYFVNETYTYVLGSDPLAKAEIRNRQRINHILWVVLLIFLLFSMNNVINICISKWSGIIKIHKQIGTNMISLIWHMVFLVTLYAVLGEILGIAIGYGFIRMIKDVLLNSAVTTGVRIPWNILLGFMAAGIGIIVVIMNIKLRALYQKTSYEIQHSSGGTFCKRKRVIMYEDLFGRVIPNSFRMALRNMWFYKVRKVMMILCVSVSMLLLYLIYFQMKTENSKEADNNYNYTYRIRMQNHFSIQDKEELDIICSLYHQILELCESYDCNPQFADFVYEEIQLDKSLISDSYRAQMEQSVTGHTNLADSRSFVLIHAAVMACSREVIGELCRENRLDISHLEDNQCLMLGRTVNREGTYSGILNSAVGNKYKFAPYDPEKVYELEVAGMVKDVPVYPEVMENCVCMIISEEAYLKYHENDYFEMFFLKDVPKELIEEIEHVISGTKYIILTDQEDETAVARRNRKTNNMMYLVFFLMCNAAMFLNILLIHYYEFLLRDYEFSLHGAVGISKGASYRICICEMVILYALGLLMGMAGIFAWKERIGNSAVVTGNSMANGIWTGMLGICFLISLFISYIRIRRVSVLEYYVE